MQFIYGVILLLTGTHACLAANITLLPHRAVYDLELSESQERSGIRALTGRIVYDFNGSLCEGYTTTIRYVSKINTQDSEKTIDQQTTTFESANGKEFQFLTKNFVDQNLEKEIRGSAIEENQKINVEIKQPKSAHYTLDHALFPNAHLKDLLKRAQDGQKIYEMPLFDASDNADHAVETTVLIGKKNKQHHESKILNNAQYYPVSVAYFNPTSASGDERPIYQTAFHLYETGITSNLKLNYEDFSITGTLVDLKLLKQSSCQEK
jgi:EipB-like